MKKTVIITAAILAVVLAAVPAAADAVELPDVEQAASGEETDYKAEMYDKYADLIEALEAEKYQDAIDMIGRMRPEVKEGQVELTLDNWEEYFVVEPVHWNYEYDAYGDIDREFVSYNLRLRPEYQGHHIELEGTIGYLYQYGFYEVASVNPEDGTFEVTETDMSDAGWIPSDFYGEQSESKGLNGAISMDEGITLAKLHMDAREKNGNDGVGGQIVLVKDADKYIQKVAIPENFQIVRIEGTIKIGE